MQEVLIQTETNISCWSSSPWDSKQFVLVCGLTVFNLVVSNDSIISFITIVFTFRNIKIMFILKRVVTCNFIRLTSLLKWIWLHVHVGTMYNVLSISGCAVHAFIISNFVFVIFINRKTFQRGQLTHHWMTFAQNWLIMMKVVMVGADDSGLRSTGDDGVTLIMTYLLLFRQWMFLYSCWINSP